MNAKKSLTLTGVAVAIAATGGSQLANAGIDRGGSPDSSSKGKVSGFGSIYVNGVRYNTDNAIFVIDGVVGTESDLAVGQIVSVLGSIDDDSENGTALIVKYDDAVEGPISAIDVAANRVTVLGQTVMISEDTAFSMASGADTLTALATGTAIEVSGYVDADGNIAATYVGDATTFDGYDVTGTISSVSAGGMTFAVNGLEVDYSAANLYDLPYGIPSVGQQVEVLGATTDDAGRFAAEHVWMAQQGIDRGGNTIGEVEGLITNWRSYNEFEIDGLPVRIRWGTGFVNGWIFDLNLNRKVEVEGTFDADGVLVAETIMFERDADANRSGRVDAVFGDTLYVDGAAVHVTPKTAYDDDSDADERRFNIADVRSGDFLEIAGYQTGGDFVATRLVRDDEEDEQDDD